MMSMYQEEIIIVCVNLIDKLVVLRPSEASNTDTKAID